MNKKIRQGGVPCFLSGISTSVVCVLPKDERPGRFRYPAPDVTEVNINVYKVTRNLHKRTMAKKTLTIKHTLDGSVKQHEFYKGKWKPLVKESAIDKTLWLVGELGEVIDIIKKNHLDDISDDKNIRTEFVKEVVDCYMYLADVLNCFNISPEEVSKTYFDKLDFNLKNPRKYWKKK